jgi:hypothetical protein
MKKIFPFYKGKNIANNPLGYTTVANARKRMKSKEVTKDFIESLPKDYWLDYYEVYELENPWDESIRLGRYRTGSGHWYGIDTYTNGYVKIDSRKYIKELPEDVYSLFLKLYNLEKFVMEDYYSGKETYKEEYQNILYDILRKGYYPTLFKDEKDYKKRWARFVTDNVEFKEMDVDITVK